MSNGRLHDDKLFQGLHDRLSDYEAPYNGADWDAMNRALDKLPKSNNFRWKFSLNTIGIVLGIMGLTVVGVVLASGPDKTRPSENATTVTTPSDPVTPAAANVQTPNSTQPAPADVAVNATIPVANSFDGMNSHRDLSNPKREEQKFDNPFRLGDQVDPIKGWVKQTQEDPALLQNHTDLKQPEVYYDIDENGKVKPIYIPHDGKDSSMKEIQQDSLPQAPANIGPEPAAPTDGQRYGFGDDHP